MSLFTGDVRSLLKRLRGRPDSEHEMSVNRVGFALLALIVTLAWGLDAHTITVLMGFCAISFVVFLHLLLDGRAVEHRRMLMIGVDTSMICYFMYANDRYAAGFWPLLLWTILGNGFRFGTRYLFAATALSIVGFALVFVGTPFWRANMPLAVGLLVGLVALPAYAGTLIRKLSKATAAAEEASRAKSYFLASVSHELRTPLTAIIGLGAHLAEAEGSADDRAMAGTIVSAGRQLLSMINRLLDYSRVEAKAAEVECKPFDLAAMMAAVRELMQFQAQEKGLRINLHLAADTRTALRGDEQRLRDILINLVGNAVKFTHDGSITIVASIESDGAGRQQLRLVVADTGIGIAEDAQGHIFGSFRQADDTIIDRYGGTGLGLAICRQLATLLGGEIGVDSRPDAGSRFWFTARVEVDPPSAAIAPEARLLLFSDDAALSQAIGRGVVRRDDRAAICALYDPAIVSILLVDARLLARQSFAAERDADFAELLHGGAVPILIADVDDPLPEADLIERSFVLRLGRTPSAAQLDRAVATATVLGGLRVAPPPIAGPDIMRTSRRILVADDNVMNRKVFGMLLGRAGHEVTCVEDGEQALDLMRDHHFDVVLMDVNMPAMNGIEATKLYRFANLGQKRLPIVGVTADASPETAERCLDAGMDACIAKPVEADALLELIDLLVVKSDAPPRFMVPAFDPAGVVTPLVRIAATDADPAIDWHSLDELEELGGEAFVSELLEVYLLDAQTVLDAVSASVAAADVAAFRLNAHALRSSAANIGAVQVAELCLHYQRIGESEFVESGARHRDRLAAELSRVAATLAQWPARRGVAAG